MAKTNGKTKTKTENKTDTPEPSAQVEMVMVPKDWSPAAILAALKRSRDTTDPVTRLKRAGILDKNGKLSKRFTDWGDKPSRTPST